MPLALLLDENLPGRLARAIARHNARGLFPLDAVRLGDPPDLPLGSDDPTILHWAERANRLLVTLDEQTMPAHLADHLRTAHHSPGILMIRASASLPEVVEFLVLIAYASEPAEWWDSLRYLP